MSSEFRKRLARALVWTMVPVVLIIWIYHVLIGGADPLLAAIWTVNCLLAVLVAVPIALYLQRRGRNRQ